MKAYYSTMESWPSHCVNVIPLSSRHALLALLFLFQHLLGIATIREGQHVESFVYFGPHQAGNFRYMMDTLSHRMGSSDSPRHCSTPSQPSRWVTAAT